MSFKNIIIVGNASTVLLKENGQKIDAFDYIVRMGDMPRIKGYEKYVGTRTDMLRVKWFNMFKAEQGVDDLSKGLPRDNNEIIFNDILFSFQDCDEYCEVSPAVQRYYNISLNRSFLYPIGNRIIHDYCCYIHELYKKNIFYFNTSDFESLQYHFLKETDVDLHEKWIEPSGGLCVLWYFIQHYRASNIYITGFDGFRTHHYWKPDVDINFHSHNGALEQIFLKKLIKKGVVYEL